VIEISLSVQRGVVVTRIVTAITLGLNAYAGWIGSLVPLRAP
jgi:hypothetical protein